MPAQLYCFGESGNAYKAALTMTLSSYPWVPVWVDFFHGETRTERFRAINAMGEVPVLVDGDLILTQSNLIQLHVAERTGMFLGETEENRREVLRWLFWDVSKGSGQFGPLRFMMNFLPEDRRSPDVIAWASGRAAASLDVLEAHLARREWLVGDGLTLADLACCGYLYYPEPFGFVRRERPAISGWLDRISALPGWAHPYDLMPGHPSERT
ncbi:glutathione S-transferase family protein [Falsirhodobacter sp. 20TX0035]|uniref:glutathione S-transferase family protein n=1 Tax=Falsirhodobacter sp. 20TX0035 TaxID=3022019 RepID=UPI0023305920|nr:glutathione S-transferase family protein [Falsirhodobacter sp. 20TX0035]MDB6454141.1 glutathione S-transferase family protein [Falsirhodobacter sp. 20TX0035]